MKRALGFFIAALLTSSAATGREIDWDKTIRVGRSHVYNLVGTVDSDALTAYLAPTGKVPKSLFGRSMVVLSVFENEDVEGCGCPERFNEFTLVYLLDEEGPRGEKQISPDFQVTNEYLRQTSVAFKFGTMVDLAPVGFAAGRGFYVQDAQGRPLLRGRPVGGMPEARRTEEIRYGSHSLGGEQLGVPLVPTYSQITGPIRAGYQPFLKGLDLFEVDEQSTLGIHLERLGFKPLYWQSMEATSDMWVRLIN